MIRRLGGYQLRHRPRSHRRTIERRDHLPPGGGAVGRPGQVQLPRRRIDGHLHTGPRHRLDFERLPLATGVAARRQRPR